MQAGGLGHRAEDGVHLGGDLCRHMVKELNRGDCLEGIIVGMALEDSSRHRLIKADFEDHRARWQRPLLMYNSRSLSVSQTTTNRFGSRLAQLGRISGVVSIQVQNDCQDQEVPPDR